MRERLARFMAGRNGVDQLNNFLLALDVLLAVLASVVGGAFGQLKGRFLGRFRLLKERWVQRRDYKFFTCPACRTTLRVPKGRGKIRIVCRKCGASFTGKS